MPWAEFMTARRPTGSMRFRSAALAIAVAYGGVGAFWIAGSDWLIFRLLGQTEAMVLAATFKGWLYVALTAVILYFAIKKALDWASRTNEQRLHQVYHLDFTLRELGGLWELDCRTGAVKVSYHLKMLLGLPADFRDDAESWNALLHPDDRGRIEAAFDAAIRNPGRTFHEIYRIRNAAGDLLWFQTRGRVMRDNTGAAEAVTGISIDVTALYETQAQLAYLANHDSLTNLPNRMALVRWLGEALARSQTRSGGGGRVLLLRFDIAHFNELNTTYGHQEGDRILRDVGDRLRDLSGSEAFVAHLGGDEFAVVHAHVRSHVSARQMVERLAEALAVPLPRDDGRAIHLTLRCGAAISPDDGSSGEELMLAAGLALVKCKEDQMTRFFYAQGMDAAFRLTAERSQALRGAIERGEMQVHYQPVVSLASGWTVGFEALVRWYRPEEGLVPPDAFIRIAEDIGMIEALGQWVLETACREINSLPFAPVAEGAAAEGPFVAINVSPLQIGSDQLVACVASILAKTGLAPGRLELEITESALARNYRLAAERLRPLRDLGISIAIDDFGTGYSSFTALRHLPYSRLKLDKSFVRDYGRDKSCTVILDAVVALARGMELEVTAEGVESADLLDRMQQAGCSLAQGYFFSPAVPLPDVTALCSRRWFVPGGDAIER